VARIATAPIVRAFSPKAGVTDLPTLGRTANEPLPESRATHRRGSRTVGQSKLANVNGAAVNVDPHLKNGWEPARGASTTGWVKNGGTGTADFALAARNPALFHFHHRERHNFRLGGPPAMPLREADEAPVAEVAKRHGVSAT
jgi:hypothetical protein